MPSKLVDATGEAASQLPPGRAQGVYAVRAGTKALRLTVGNYKRRQAD